MGNAAFLAGFFTPVLMSKSGHRRLHAALEIGHPVLASDGTGEIFCIAMEDGRMTVTPASGEQSGGVVVTVARVHPVCLLI